MYHQFPQVGCQFAEQGSLFIGLNHQCPGQGIVFLAKKANAGAELDLLGTFG